jgi:tetratricopeptide (TPR) repeat protein/predicted Ser/Thr protein kinase
VGTSKLVKVGEVKEHPGPNNGPEAGSGLDAENASGDQPVAGPSSASAAVKPKLPDTTEVLSGSATSEPPGPLPPPVIPRMTAGVAVGRYQLVELIGSGGMGSVYRAHDPHLSRDVALKVLHPTYAGERVGSDYRHRLLREAQALAKLSHPNVVAAFDVGTHEDVVFVAMELVQGESLRTWIHGQQSVSEVLRVLIAAGRGLVAAHTAGVLHRDFKPANVMVSPDGRVRVVDFGLARSALAGADPDELAAATGPESSPASERRASLLEGEITESGLLMGTPGYIAPEQLHGAPANVLTDQYSFAVTAFVALSGQGPPPVSGGERDAALAWPREVPRRVRRVVERGLARDAFERHPSVAAMVDELEHANSPRRRAGWAVAAALGAAALAGGAALWQLRANRVTCHVGPEPFQHVWDAERRAKLRAALTATRRANADEAFGLLSGRLDAFQSAWVGMKQESCEATHVRGEQSEKVLALRNGCLEHKRAGVGALVTAFSQPDPAAVDRAAGAMPDSLDDCADTAALLGTEEKLPASPEVRASIARLESEFAVARSLTVAGRWKEARERSEQLLAEARTLGHDPTTARALRGAAFTVWSQARNADERRQAEAYLREAIPLAANAGDDQLVAKTASYLFNLLAYGQRRVQEAEAMLPHVEALVIRGGNHPHDRLELLYGQARMMSQRRKLAEATALFEQVIELSDSIGSEWGTYGANARGELGEIFMLQENYPEALRRMQASVAALEKIYGGHHPRLLIALANRALAESKVDGDAALATVAQMRELAGSLATEDWRTITIPFLEGQVREDRGDCARALPFYRDALVRFDTVHGDGSAQSADVHARLGACLAATGQRGEALAELERVLSIRRANGDTPNIVAEAAYELAQVLAAHGSRPADRSRARELAQEARSLWERDGITDKVRAVDQWLEAAVTPAPPLQPKVAKK